MLKLFLSLNELCYSVCDETIFLESWKLEEHFSEQRLRSFLSWFCGKNEIFKVNWRGLKLRLLLCSGMVEEKPRIKDE